MQNIPVPLVSIRAHLCRRGFAILVAMLLVSGQLWAQSSSSDRILARQNYVTLLGIPSATVAPRGLAFVHVLTVANVNAGSAETGDALAVGFGFGDADQGLGYQFTALANAATMSFGRFGYFGVKVSRKISSGAAPTYLALSLDQLGKWGDAAGLEHSATLIVTRFSTLDNASNGRTYPVMMTVGAGSHVRNLASDPGVFLGAGIGLTRNFGMSSAWNGDNVNIGAAFRFDDLKNVGFTVSLSDTFNQQERQQLSFGLSWFFDTAQGR